MFSPKVSLSDAREPTYCSKQVSVKLSLWNCLQSEFGRYLWKTGQAWYSRTLCVCVRVYVCVCALARARTQQAPGLLSHHPSSLLQPVTYHTQQDCMLPFWMDSWFS